MRSAAFQAAASYQGEGIRYPRHAGKWRPLLPGWALRFGSGHAALNNVGQSLWLKKTRIPLPLFLASSLTLAFGCGRRPH